MIIIVITSTGIETNLNRLEKDVPAVGDITVSILQNLIGTGWS